MRRPVLFLIAFLFLAGVSESFDVVPPGDSYPDFEVRSFNVKQIESGGLYTRYSMKVDIENSGPSGEFFVTVKAYDKDGFELDSTTFSGFINSGQLKSLTDRFLLSNEHVPNLVEWRIDSVHRN